MAGGRDDGVLFFTKCGYLMGFWWCGLCYPLTNVYLCGEICALVAACSILVLRYHMMALFLGGGTVRGFDVFYRLIAAD